ncbi:Hypothetical predicted protein [Pelobates cultripes]|uniref:Uncharacterized protein n=1 Tax=Pelobates cultripes TaxID=61616 RepID=A0AAD1T086_PELCU|nr:Hypothetical predicted protein [Pelobates cultripes]
MGDEVPLLVYHDRASQGWPYRELTERPDQTGVQSWDRCQWVPPALAEDVSLVWTSEGNQVLTILDIRKQNPPVPAEYPNPHSPKEMKKQRGMPLGAPGSIVPLGPPKPTSLDPKKPNPARALHRMPYQKLRGNSHPTLRLNQKTKLDMRKDTPEAITTDLVTNRRTRKYTHL